MFRRLTYSYARSLLTYNPPSLRFDRERRLPDFEAYGCEASFDSADGVSHRLQLRMSCDATSTPISQAAVEDVV
jgi:hypothetical protein